MSQWLPENHVGNPFERHYTSAQRSTIDRHRASVLDICHEASLPSRMCPCRPGHRMGPGAHTRADCLQVQHLSPGRSDLGLGVLQCPAADRVLGRDNTMAPEVVPAGSPLWPCRHVPRESCGPRHTRLRGAMNDREPGHQFGGRIPGRWNRLLPHTQATHVAPTTDTPDEPIRHGQANPDNSSAGTLAATAKFSRGR